MAITAATTLSSDFSGFIDEDKASAIFEDAARQSIAQRLGRQIPLSYRGVDIPVVSGTPTASWVSEAGQKPASEGSMTLSTMSPKKLATIVVVSSEVVRANPGGYMDLLRPQIAEAFADAFDAAVFHGTSTPFSAYLDQTTKAVEIGANTPTDGGVWQDLVTALDLLVTAGKKLTGWALDDVLEPNLLGAVDANGRPIFTETPLTDAAPTTGAYNINSPRIGRLMGRPTFMHPNVGTSNNTTVVGYAGDWTQVAWGVVGGISYDISTEASVTINGTLTSLWEYNLLAIRAEAEYGLVINDTSAFVRLTNTSGS